MRDLTVEFMKQMISFKLFFQINKFSITINNKIIKIAIAHYTFNRMNRSSPVPSPRVFSETTSRHSIFDFQPNDTNNTKIFLRHNKECSNDDDGKGGEK
jgi:hypothetical protein